MSETPAGPGWYDDPDDPSLLRYFDGVVWSAHTTPRTSPTAGASTIGHANDVPRGATRTGWSQPGPGPSAQGQGPGQEQGQYPGQGQWGPGQGGMPPAQGWGTAYGQSWPRKDVLPDGDVLAEWWRRLVARIIDSVITSVLAVLVAIPWLGDAVRVMRRYLDESAAAASSGAVTPDLGAFTVELSEALVPVTVASLVVALVYEVAFLTWRAATPGKMVLGTVVRPVAAAGPVSLVTAVRRQAITVLASVMAFVPLLGAFSTVLNILDPAWLLWDPKRQALHDKVAETVVVLKRR